MNDIKKLQSQDPLSIAEKITGNEYKKDDATVWLGMAIQMEKTKELNKLLDAADDTKFSEKTEEYLRKVTSFGFETVLHDMFDSDGVTEDYYVLWHKDYSILLSFDTFRGNRNGGKFCYNWSPNKSEYRGSLLSSGGFSGMCWKEDFSSQIDFSTKKPSWKIEQSHEEFSVKWDKWNKEFKQHVDKNNLRSVWVGDHDCREAVKNNIILLAENGVFIKKWIKQPFLWLLSHGDSKKDSYSYEDITKERISRLPDYVKKCILPDK